MAPSDPDAVLAARVLDALPCATLLVDGAYRVVRANEAARGRLGVNAGAALGEALGCIDAAGLPCGAGARCAGCTIRETVRRALEGARGAGRGFLLRAGEGGEPADLHLLMLSAPLAVDAAPHAVLVLQDANELLSDPAIVRVCGACGRVEDQEHEWHPLHHYLEDRLGLEESEVLCGDCARRAGPAGEP